MRDCSGKMDIIERPFRLLRVQYLPMKPTQPHPLQLKLKPCHSSQAADNIKMNPLLSLILCWLNGQTEPVRPILRPLFRDTEKPSSCIQSGKGHIITLESITTRSWNPKRPSPWERKLR